jgi:hypothetical protein
MDPAQVDEIDWECFAHPFTACPAMAQRDGVRGARDRADVITAEKTRFGVPNFRPVEGIEAVIRDEALGAGGGILDAVDTSCNTFRARAATARLDSTCVSMPLHQDGLEDVHLPLESF